MEKKSFWRNFWEYICMTEPLESFEQRLEKMVILDGLKGFGQLQEFSQIELMMIRNPVESMICINNTDDQMQIYTCGAWRPHYEYITPNKSTTLDEPLDNKLLVIQKRLNSIHKRLKKLESKNKE